MSGALIITGGAAQIGGFGLTYYELARTLRREFPDYVPPHNRALAWARRRLGLRKPRSMTRAASDSLNISEAVSVEMSRAPATTMPERVSRLEAEMKDLRSKQRDDHAALVGRVVEAGQRIADTEGSLKAELGDMERARKESLRDSLVFQRLGVVLFVLGTVLGVLGSTL